MTGSGDISYEELAQRGTSCEGFKRDVQYIMDMVLLVARRKDCIYFRRPTTGSKWYWYGAGYCLKRDLEVVHPHIQRNILGELRSGPLLESLDPYDLLVRLVAPHSSPKFTQTCRTVCFAGGFHV